MNRTSHICLMANYNEWMNAKIYEAARSLSDEELSVDRKAFFGSILGTLNHVVAGDTVWLNRFAKHPANYLALAPIQQLPAPKSLDQLLFSNIRDLSAHRVWLDQQIVKWSDSIAEPDMDAPSITRASKEYPLTGAFMAWSCIFSTIRRTTADK